MTGEECLANMQRQGCVIEVMFGRRGHLNTGHPAEYVQVVSDLDGYKHHVAEGTDSERVLALIEGDLRCSAAYFRAAIETLFLRADAVYGSLHMHLDLRARDAKVGHSDVPLSIVWVHYAASGQGGFIQKQEERHGAGPFMTSDEIAAVVRSALETPFVHDA